MTVKGFFERKKGFFIDNPIEIAVYARKQYENEALHVIRIADDVCAKSYLFDLRWDMERTYEPVIFTDKIDWMYKPADDPEWVYAFNRHRFFICLGQAYVMTGDEKYAQAYVAQLCDWIDCVRRDDPSCSPAWRTIEAGLRLEYWLKSFCYFENSPLLTDEVCDKFVNSVTEHAEYLMEVYDTFRLMSNWGVIQNHGLFLAGVFLPQSERTKAYIRTSVERLTEEMRIQIYRDGMHWEQSPMYHNEVSHCYLDVVILARRNGIELPGIIVEMTKAMCYAGLYSQKPDHCEIMQGDSDDIDIRDIITKGAYIFRDPELKYGGYEAFDFECIWDMGMEALREYEAIPARIPSDTSRAFTDSGNVCMRSGWVEKACFLHFHCGTMGAGHGHSDKLHIDLFANGEDILVDAGRYTYVNKPERHIFKSPSAHNTTTVDGLDFTVSKDSWECSKLSQAANQRHWFSEAYDYAEGGHLGYMALESGGVFVNRRIIFIKPDIFVLLDEFYSGTENSYRQYFHFNNAGKVSCGERVLYESESNTAELIFAIRGIEKTMIPSLISRHYNKAEANPCVMTHIKGSGFTSVISVISISEAGKQEKTEVRKVEVKSNFKGITFGDDIVEAVTIEKGNRRYTVVMAHQEYASPTDTFCADGCTGFGQAVVFDRVKGEERIGTVLKW